MAGVSEINDTHFHTVEKDTFTVKGADDVVGLANVTARWADLVTATYEATRGNPASVDPGVSNAGESVFMKFNTAQNFKDCFEIMGGDHLINLLGTQALMLPSGTVHSTPGVDAGRFVATGTFESETVKGASLGMKFADTQMAHNIEIHRVYGRQGNVRWSEGSETAVQEVMNLSFPNKDSSARNLATNQKGAWLSRAVDFQNVVGKHAFYSRADEAFNLLTAVGGFVGAPGAVVPDDKKFYFFSEAQYNDHVEGRGTKGVWTVPAGSEYAKTKIVMCFREQLTQRGWLIAQIRGFLLGDLNKGKYLRDRVNFGYDRIQFVVLDMGIGDSHSVDTDIGSFGLVTDVQGTGEYKVVDYMSHIHTTGEKHAFGYYTHFDWLQAVDAYAKMCCVAEFKAAQVIDDRVTTQHYVHSSYLLPVKSTDTIKFDFLVSDPKVRRLVMTRWMELSDPRLSVMTTADPDQLRWEANHMFSRKGVITDLIFQAWGFRQRKDKTGEVRGALAPVIRASMDSLRIFHTFITGPKFTTTNSRGMLIDQSLAAVCTESLSAIYNDVNTVINSEKLVDLFPWRTNWTQYGAELSFTNYWNEAHKIMRSYYWSIRGQGILPLVLIQKMRRNPVLNAIMLFLGVDYLNIDFLDMIAPTQEVPFFSPWKFRGEETRLKPHVRPTDPYAMNIKLGLYDYTPIGADLSDEAALLGFA